MDLFDRLLAAAQDRLDKEAMTFAGAPSMPQPSVGGSMRGARFVGGTGGGRRLVGSDAGASMVMRHRANLAAQQMMQQNEFSKAYANALGRMSRASVRHKNR